MKLISGRRMSDSSPSADNLRLYMLAAAALAIVFTISGPVEDARERELIIKGGYLSWQVADACTGVSTSCDQTVREVNQQAKRYGVTVGKDGTLYPR